MTQVSRTLLGTDFTAGVEAGDVAGASSPWRLRALPGLPLGDGALSVGTEGLIVTTTGADPKTGEPAFVLPTHAALSEGDHLRWAMFADRDTAAGMPGIALEPDDHVMFGAELSMRGYGLDRELCRSASTDSERDLRLGAAALIMMDRETGLVLDAVVTHRRVFAVYERLAFPGATHGGFSYVVPIADRDPSDVHTLAVLYDRRTGAVRWQLGGDDVLVITEPGRRLAGHESDKLRDNGLPDETVRPRQVTGGVAIFANTFVGQGVRLTVRRMALDLLARPASVVPAASD